MIDVRDVTSDARGFAMALASAAEALNVLVNPIVSEMIFGTHPGSGTGEEVQSSLIALRSQSPLSCNCSDNCALKSKMLDSSLLISAPTNPTTFTLIALSSSSSMLDSVVAFDMDGDVVALLAMLYLKNG